MSHIGKLFKAARKEAGLTLMDVVLLAGYKNITKGMRHLQSLEEGQTLLPNSTIVEKFVAALSIDDADIEAAFALDWKEFNRPVQPYLIERLMPAVYRRHELPEGCTVDDAYKIGSKMSVETGRSFCLVLSKVRTVYFYPNGKSSVSNYVPGTSIGRFKSFMIKANSMTNGRMR